MLTIHFEFVTIDGQQFIRIYGVKPSGSTVGLYRRAA